MDNIGGGGSECRPDEVSAREEEDLERAVALTTTHAAMQQQCTANELLAVQSVTDIGADDYLFQDDLKNDLQKV